MKKSVIDLFSGFNLSSSNKSNLAAELAGSRLAEVTPVNRHEFMLFKELLYKQAGIHLAPSKTTLLESRLGSRLIFYGFKTYFDYYQQVLRDENELQIFIDLLTTNETFFFREIAHFDYLQQHILPHYRYSPMRVWSAACSSGEETYSLGMILDDTLVNRNWELIGSDISQRVLEKAAAGHYQMQRHEGIPAQYLKKYCLRGTGSQEGTLLIHQGLRERVQFSQVNLNAQLATMGQFDVIFLRNVLIYFNQEKKEDIVRRVVNQLKPGGHLFISHTENLQGIDLKLNMIRPSIFQKSGGTN
ncbi:protein-glutamate O-methyltransferase CheR [Vibrio sp. JC009]|uniref:CheR family methyltransferase n=1 Tax=Vibrio sp. JC009 TaxID=2912314 RepID=UPI0023AFADE4|nr:protein-glutamate O-methyltransferase CheR [Vibrio sp. JC009]WED23403.1 protein-glutamate O-methyltransferase CheR [Vibrio sp. JC009]